MLCYAIWQDNYYCHLPVYTMVHIELKFQCPALEGIPPTEQCHHTKDNNSNNSNRAKNAMLHKNDNRGMWFKLCNFYIFHCKLTEPGIYWAASPSFLTFGRLVQIEIEDLHETIWKTKLSIRTQLSRMSARPHVPNPPI